MAQPVALPAIEIPSEWDPQRRSFVPMGVERRKALAAAGAIAAGAVQLLDPPRRGVIGRLAQLVRERRA